MPALRHAWFMSQSGVEVGLDVTEDRGDALCGPDVFAWVAPWLSASCTIPIKTGPGFGGQANTAASQPDGTRVVTASNDARLWEASAVQKPDKPGGHTVPVRCTAFSPDGTRFVTASDDWKAKVSDARTGTPLDDLPGHIGSGPAPSPSAGTWDGTLIVTASDDGTARVFDAATGQVQRGAQGQHRLAPPPSQQIPGFSPRYPRHFSGRGGNAFLGFQPVPVLKINNTLSTQTIFC